MFLAGDGTAPTPGADRDSTVSDNTSSDNTSSDNTDHVEILRPETLELMRTPAVAPGDPAWLGSYGLGVQHLRFGDRVYFGHTGSMPGFLAMMMSSASDGLTVSMQANAWSELATRALVGDLFDIVGEREPTMPVAWTPASVAEPSNDVPSNDVPSDGEPSNREPSNREPSNGEPSNGVARAAAEDGYALVGPWYWGAVAMAVTLRADGLLHLNGIGGGGRSARFRRVGDGRWIGLNGYYHGELLEIRRDRAGAVTHLDLGSFVFTRNPYAPGDVVPGGLDLGDWPLGPGATDIDNEFR